MQRLARLEQWHVFTGVAQRRRSSACDLTIPPHLQLVITHSFILIKEIVRHRLQVRGIGCWTISNNIILFFNTLEVTLITFCNYYRVWIFTDSWAVILSHVVCRGRNCRWNSWSFSFSFSVFPSAHVWSVFRAGTVCICRTCDHAQLTDTREVAEFWPIPVECLMGM